MRGNEREVSPLFCFVLRNAQVESFGAGRDAYITLYGLTYSAGHASRKKHERTTTIVHISTVNDNNERQSCRIRIDTLYLLNAIDRVHSRNFSVLCLIYLKYVRCLYIVLLQSIKFLR